MDMNKFFKYFLAGTGILVTSSLPCCANVGVPMLVIAWPFFGITFIPIVIIEWLTLRKWLPTYAKGRLFWASFYANLFSTVLGIPLSWGGMLLMQISVPGGGGTFPSVSPFWRSFLGVTVQSAWLIPYEQQLYWMIPTALLVLLIPFFFISYALEASFSTSYLRKDAEKPQHIKKAVWKANRNSYGMLAIVVLLYLVGVCVQQGTR